MGQVVSNIVSSCSTTSNEYEDDIVDERSSRSGKHDHEEIQKSRFGSISSTTALSSSSSSLLHPFAVLLTTSTTDVDDHSNNQNSDDEAVHGSHVTTAASIVKRLVTISDYNFVEKNSSETEINDHDHEAALVLELSAQYRQEEGILVVEKVLDNQDDELHHHNNNQVIGGGAEEVEDFLEEKREERRTAQISVSSTTTTTVTHSSSSSLHPVAVLLTSTTINDHHHNITDLNGISTADDEASSHDSHHGDGGATLLMVSQPQSQSQSQSQKEEIVTENVLDDDHQNTPENGVGVAKEVENDDIDEKFIIIKTGNEQIIKERVIKHYSNRHKILLVGEGDFSFSACLARYFRSGINMVATSFDYQYMVVEKHWSAEGHVEELKRLGCKVLHGVDVHTMDSHSRLKRMRPFDRIVYNFPHAGHFPSYCEFDLIEMHQELLLGFFKSASKMLVDDGGEVHVSHRDDPPYDQWEIVKLAKKAGLALKEKVEFEKKDYPGYHNKRGGGIQSNKTFPLGYSSFTFKFIISTTSTFTR